MAYHELKVEQKRFYDLQRGNKKCEVRYNDRNYQKGDVLFIRGVYSYIEFVSWTKNRIISAKTLPLCDNPSNEAYAYSGDELLLIVTHVETYQQQENWVVLSVARLVEAGSN